MLKIKQEDKDSYSHQLRPSQTLTQGGLTALSQCRIHCWQVQGSERKRELGYCSISPSTQPFCK